MKEVLTERERWGLFVVVPTCHARGTFLRFPNTSKANNPFHTFDQTHWPQRYARMSPMLIVKFAGVFFRTVPILARRVAQEKQKTVAILESQREFKRT